MASLTKTLQGGIGGAGLQTVAANTVVKSSVLDVSTKYAIQVFLHFGRRTGTVLAAPVTMRIEGSSKASGDGHWYELATFSSSIIAAATQAVNATASSGQAVIPIATTGSFSVNDIIYIDNGTIANSEWGRIKSKVTNVSVTIEDNLNFAQTSSTIYNMGEIYAPIVDVSNETRVRLVYNAAACDQGTAFEAFWASLDSIS